MSPSPPIVCCRYRSITSVYVADHKVEQCMNTLVRLTREALLTQVEQDTIKYTVPSIDPASQREKEQLKEMWVASF